MSPALCFVHVNREHGLVIFLLLLMSPSSKHLADEKATGKLLIVRKRSALEGRRENERKNYLPKNLKITVDVMLRGLTSSMPAPSETLLKRDCNDLDSCRALSVKTQTLRRNVCKSVSHCVLKPD